jgi:hypothetical protein
VRVHEAGSWLADWPEKTENMMARFVGPILAFVSKKKKKVDSWYSGAGSLRGSKNRLPITGIMISLANPRRRAYFADHAYTAGL